MTSLLVVSAAELARSAGQGRAGRRKRWRRLARWWRFTGYTPGWVGRQVLLATSIGALAALGLYASVGITLMYALPLAELWLAASALLLLRQLLAPLRAQPAGVNLRIDPALAEGTRTGAFPLADRWERRIEATVHAPDRYAEVVRDRVRLLAAERLRQRGIHLAAEPDRAATVLGPELYQFLTGPIDRPPSPPELGRLLTRLEEA